MSISIKKSQIENHLPIWMKPEALIWLEVRDASGQEVI